MKDVNIDSTRRALHQLNKKNERKDDDDKTD